jgi:hypothetical protein
MDWQAFPILTKRRAIAPPPLKPLPQLNYHIFNTFGERTAKTYNEYIDPDKRY